MGSRGQGGQPRVRTSFGEKEIGGASKGDWERKNKGIRERSDGYAGKSSREETKKKKDSREKAQRKLDPGEERLKQKG